jgi:tRNA(Ile)-lysidine synthase
MTLLRQVEATIQDFDLFESGDKALVAVSGGADSVCLLLILKKLARRLGIRLSVFHLNHRLRGRDAVSDQNLVIKFCRRLNVPCFVMSADVRGYSRSHKLSLEEAGRELRYRFLDQVAKASGCNRVVTAHNANDNAETVLMNLCRGSGLTGLSGIPVRRGNIVRPLIRIERKDIEQFLAEQHVPYAHDISNQKLEFRRNLVRHRVLPILKRLNPQVVPAILRTSELLRAEDACLAHEARTAVRRVARAAPDGSFLDTASLLKYNICIQRRVIKSLIPGLSFDDVSKVLGIASGRLGGRSQLSGGSLCVKEARGLFLGQERAGISRTPTLLRVPGENRPAGFRVRLDVKTSSRKPQFVRPNTEVFDLDGLSLPLEMRTRQPGDRFAPFGGRTRKLQDILVDDRIPRRERDSLPLLCDQRGILWAIGSRRAGRASVKENTRRFMIVKCSAITDLRGASQSTRSVR